MKLGSKSVACKEENSHWRCCKNTSIFSFRWSDYWCTILVHPVVKSCVILLCVSYLRHKILKYMCFIVQVQPCFSYKCFVTDSKYISVLCSKVLLEIIFIWSSRINGIIWVWVLFCLSFENVWREVWSISVPSILAIDGVVCKEICI